MATFIDITALQNFSHIFVFLYVWLGVYGILLYTKFLGQNKFLPILISMMLGLFVLFSDLAVRVILKTVPWIVALFIFIFLTTIATQSFGGTGNASTFGGLNYVLLVIVAIAVIVGALAEIRQTVGVPGDNETSTDFDRDFTKTSTIFFHPSFLGMMFLLAIAIFTIALLASSKQ